MTDPFAVLGVAPTATLAEVRAARRRLAMELHPDRGGDEVRMREVNRAFDQVVRSLLGRPERVVTPSSAPTTPPPPAERAAPRFGPWIQYDEPSFTIDVLPVDAFDAVADAAARLGEILAEDPPYVLEVAIGEPAPCWCRLELLPEAGGTTVMLIVAGINRRRPPPVEDVRDLWVAALNERP